MRPCEVCGHTDRYSAKWGVCAIHGLRYYLSLSDDDALELAITRGGGAVTDHSNDARSASAPSDILDGAAGRSAAGRMRG